MFAVWGARAGKKKKLRGKKRKSREVGCKTGGSSATGGKSARQPA